MIESIIDKCRYYALNAPDKIAIQTENTSLQYKDLFTKVESGAYYLSTHGINANSVVGIHIADEVDHFIATLSVLFLGASQITLASHDTSAMRDELMSRVGGNHIVTDQLSEAENENTINWTSALNFVKKPLKHKPGIVYLRTSGTTGKTNIVAFSEEQIAYQSTRHPEYANEQFLRLASIEHNNSKRHRLYCLWNGGVNIFKANSDSDLLTFIETHQVSCLDISRLHAASLAKLSNEKRLRHVRIRTGGSAIPYVLRKDIQTNVSENLYVRYASTESGAIAMAIPGDHDSDESSGAPLKGVELRILDSNGEVVPNGICGEISIKAPGMALEYFDNPEQSAKRFRDGWFYPGDVGYLRHDNQLVIQGRIDEMIIMNGLNIFPKEIEAILESHPEVIASAAFPLESRIHGHIPVAVAQMKDGATLTPSDLIKYANQYLGLKTPKKIVFVEKLPRNSQGKMVKKGLEDYFKI